MSFIEIKVRHWIKLTSDRRRVVERKKNFKRASSLKRRKQSSVPDPDPNPDPDRPDPHIFGPSGSFSASKNSKENLIPTVL
jgi:hypothetical protein